MNALNNTTDDSQAVRIRQYGLWLHLDHTAPLTEKEKGLVRSCDKRLCNFMALSEAQEKWLTDLVKRYPNVAMFEDDKPAVDEPESTDPAPGI